MRTITYKGLIANQTIHRIRLGTKKGLTGYRIKKLQVFPFEDDTIEATVKVFSVEPAGATNSANFDDPTLLGAVYFSMDSGSAAAPEDTTVVMDNKIVNQDIFITLRCHTNIASLNYYIELESIDLDLGEATVATLKDMRGNYTNQDP